MAPKCRQLGAADAQMFRELRLEALKNHPQAFGSTYAEQKARPLADYVNMLIEGCWFGALAQNTLVGMVAFMQSRETKGRHRGHVFGVYVSPDWQRQGVARTLMQALEAHASTLVRQLHLTVMANNPAAIGLYQRLGYERYGTDPRLIHLDDRYLDAYLMVKFLDQNRGKQEEAL